MKIAIIDDEPSLLKLGQHTLTQYGADRNIAMEISDFSDGESFLKDYQPGMFDVIFADVFMPGIDGVETVTRLRQTDPAVVVIFLTTSESHFKNALSGHAFDYIIKPAGISEIYKVMDECITMLGDRLSCEHRFIDFNAEKVEVRLFANQLVALSALGHYVEISAVNNDKIITYKTRSSFSVIEDKIKDWNNMLKVNRGIIINLDFVERFDGNAITMKNGEVYYARERGVTELKKQWHSYQLKQ